GSAQDGCGRLCGASRGRGGGQGHRLARVPIRQTFLPLGACIRSAFSLRSAFSFSRKIWWASVRRRGGLYGSGTGPVVRGCREEVRAGGHGDRGVVGSRREFVGAWGVHTWSLPLRFDAAHRVPAGRSRRSEGTAREAAGESDRCP